MNPKKNTIYSKFNVGKSPKLNDEYKDFFSEEELELIKQTQPIETKTSKLVRISETNYNKLKTLVDVHNEEPSKGKLSIPITLNYLLEKEFKKIK